MSKKTKKEEVAGGSPANTLPAYVQELQEKGAVVLQGRTRDELEEMLAAIPIDIQYYTGQVTLYQDSGLFRVQVNKK